MSEILLPFPAGCIKASFLRRVKRFSVESLYKEHTVWAHTNNSGSMLGLCRQGSEVLLSPAVNPARKLKWTLETIAVDDTLVGVNTLVPNRILKAAYEAGALPEIRHYTEYKAEATVGNSRLDACLTGKEGRLYIEAKNVTLVEDEVAAFPDAVTTRGQKHLHELINLTKQGVRVACFFFIQRSDCKCFGPADYIDSSYAQLLFEAKENGVEIWPVVAHIDHRGIGLSHRVPVSWG